MILHFNDSHQPDWPLKPGIYHLARSLEGQLLIDTVIAPDAMPLAELKLDRRGLWLHVAEGVRTIHVNGRWIRNIALLRAGDSIYIDGVDLKVAYLQTPPEVDAEIIEKPLSYGDPRVLLRGIGGIHHGRSFILSKTCLLGSSPLAHIRIDDPSFPQQVARFEPHPEGIILRNLISKDRVSVNGSDVQNVLLRPGDQIIIDGQHRFILEMPIFNQGAQFETEFTIPNSAVMEGDIMELNMDSRLPWLLFIAVVIGIIFAMILIYAAP